VQAIDFILDTLAHFAREAEGPPPGVPANTEGDFERELTWLCEWHNVTPIVFGSLQSLALRPNLSRITFERMKALDRASRGLTDDVLTTSHTVAGAITSRDLDLRVLGDVALATGIYPEEGARPIEKIELLVNETVWAEVVDACREAGFKTDAPLPQFENGVDAMGYFQYYPPCILENDKGDHMQLRLRLFDMGEPEVLERAWERDRNLPGRLDGVSGASIEDQLMHTALAYNMGGFGKLVHAVDLALLLNRRVDDVDWDYICLRLEARSLYPAFFFTLANAVHWLRLPVVLPLSRPGALRRKVFDAVWPAGRSSFVMRRTEHDHRLRFCLIESGRPKEKFRFLRRLLSPRHEWVAAFFRRPYKPYLKLKFIVLTLRSRIGMKSAA
jgi:hypothetical protein